MGFPRGNRKNPVMAQVAELRLVITVDDYERALAFYRDALGMPEYAAYEAPNGGRVTLLDAGRATVELADAAQADYIDEVEVGRRVAGRLRVAFQVPDAVGLAHRPAHRPGRRPVDLVRRTRGLIRNCHRSVLR
jgi:catechol 2,3-dioxygenase-like lactoylglutathione lyase family enzyme